MTRGCFFGTVVLLTVVGNVHLRGSQKPSSGAGTVSGVVTAQHGAVAVRDAAVVVTDQTGHTRAAMTDEAGRFRFPGLPAGWYRVEATVPGFRPTSQGADVTSGSTVELVLDVELVAVVEAVVIRNTSATAVSKTPSRSESIDAQAIDELDGIPGATRLLAGVVQTPGGFSIKGGRPNESSVLLGGANITDLATGGSPISLPSDAIRSVAVLPNPYSVEFGRFSSGVTVIETHTGSDRWRGRLNNFIPSLRTARHEFLSVLGVERFGPRFTGGGPLIKDRLFVVTSAEYRYESIAVPSRPDRDVTTGHAAGMFTRVDVNRGGGHRVTTSLNLQSDRRSAINMNAFTPPDAAAAERAHAATLVVSDSLPVGRSAVLDSLAQVSGQFVLVGDPDQPGTGMDVSPDKIGGHFFNAQRRVSRTLQWTETWSKSLDARGEHLFKAGVDLLRTTLTGTSRSAPVTIRRDDATVARRLSFSGPVDQRIASTDIAFFVQDRWRPIDRILLELGGRLDRDGIVRRTNATLRAGGVLVLNAAGSATLHGGVGLFYERTPSVVGAFQQFELMTDTRLAADGVTPVGPGLTLAPRVAGRLQTPRSTAWNIGVDHTMGRRGSLRINYLERRGRNAFVLESIEVGGAAELALSSAGHSEYREFEIGGRFWMGRGVDVSGSYARSRSRADTNTYDAFFGTLRAPVVSRNAYTTGSFDVPHRLVARLRYAPSDRWLISPVVELRSGVPYSLTEETLEMVMTSQQPRFPVLRMVDLSVERLIKVFRWRTWVGVRVHNLLNAPDPADVQRTITSPAFGTFYGPRPRQIRVQLRFP